MANLKLVSIFSFKLKWHVLLKNCSPMSPTIWWSLWTMLAGGRVLGGACNTKNVMWALRWNFTKMPPYRCTFFRIAWSSLGKSSCNVPFRMHILFSWELTLQIQDYLGVMGYFGACHWICPRGTVFGIKSVEGAANILDILIHLCIILFIKWALLPAVKFLFRIWPS